MPYRTQKCFDLVSVLFKTYYAMFFLVFATQHFVRYAVLLEFQRQPYFSLNATLRGFQPVLLYSRSPLNSGQFQTKNHHERQGFRLISLVKYPPLCKETQ
jgi:hypothetical protein